MQDMGTYIQFIAKYETIRLSQYEQTFANAMFLRCHEESKTNSMVHNGFLDLMNRSTCFGHYYAHHQELATMQMVSTCGSSPWLWQVAGLVHGCRFLERPVRGMFHES